MPIYRIFQPFAFLFQVPLFDLVANSIFKLLFTFLLNYLKWHSLHLIFIEYSFFQSLIDFYNLFQQVSFINQNSYFDFEIVKLPYSCLRFSVKRFHLCAHQLLS